MDWRRRLCLPRQPAPATPLASLQARYPSALCNGAPRKQPKGQRSEHQRSLIGQRSDVPLDGDRADAPLQDASVSMVIPSRLRLECTHLDVHRVRKSMR